MLRSFLNEREKKDIICKIYIASIRSLGPSESLPFELVLIVMAFFGSTITNFKMQ